MAPIRRNKGKEKMEINDKIECRPFGESSGDQRVVFNKRLSVLVSPSKYVDHFQSLFKHDIAEEEILDEPTELCEPDLGYPPEKSELADEEGVIVRDKLCLYLAGKLPA
ncbi:hypothetical protein L6452_42710 [Arctium lappa]|uniref:Uncharacterized protein n=1 Tax=Arctium lappa TaxID=4217 RepID=A0ACB8XK61_ARCLA|nr:hypothetical protein L6452_42710 [Arctium lappa]